MITSKVTIFLNKLLKFKGLTIAFGNSHSGYLTLDYIPNIPRDGQRKVRAPTKRNVHGMSGIRCSIVSALIP